MSISDKPDLLLTIYCLTSLILFIFSASGYEFVFDLNLTFTYLWATITAMTKTIDHNSYELHENNDGVTFTESVLYILNEPKNCQYAVERSSDHFGDLRQTSNKNLPRNSEMFVWPSELNVLNFIFGLITGQGKRC